MCKTSSNEQDEKKKIKCVVWDLDQTLWNGILLEGDHVTLRENIQDILAELDNRGILLSIASKNDYDMATGVLRQCGILDYFLYPQITWNSKVTSLQQIAQALNIGLDTIAFIDDQEFEREEIHFSLPQVRCIDAREISSLLTMPELQPDFLTSEAKLRRVMYRQDMERNKEEESFDGTKEAFLASLRMVLTIAPASEDDLQRLEELVSRTNQLNTTGYAYSFEELDYFRTSKQHLLLVTRLQDSYGSYGTIGLALVELQEKAWVLKLLLMSCRVMSRGVGLALLNYILRLARHHHILLQAEFIPNQRNRMMYLAYKFSGFRERIVQDNFILFEYTLEHIQDFPAYLQVKTAPSLDSPADLFRSSHV